MMDLKEEEALRGDIARHWYYRAKAAALLRCLRGLNVHRVLDVGAGSGYFSRQLLAKTNVREATCVDSNYTADSDTVLEGKRLSMRRAVASSAADLVLMMDVIEHVADDREFVCQYVALAPSGTRFVVTVPAFMWLWSGHDVFLDHYRRYNLSGLQTVLEAAGLRLERSHYFFGGVLPIVAAVRAFKRLRRGSPAGSDMRPEHPIVNNALYYLSAAEIPIMRLNKLGGTSIFAVAVKP
jgi:hypothetical protein